LDFFYGYCVGLFAVVVVLEEGFGSDAGVAAAFFPDFLRRAAKNFSYCEGADDFADGLGGVNVGFFDGGVFEYCAPEFVAFFAGQNGFGVNRLKRKQNVHPNHSFSSIQRILGPIVLLLTVAAP